MHVEIAQKRTKVNSYVPELFDNRGESGISEGVSSKRLDSLADYARARYLVRIECACGRVLLKDPHELLALIAARGWPRYTLEGLALRLKCQRCGKRPKRIGPGLGG